MNESDTRAYINRVLVQRDKAHALASEMVALVQSSCSHTHYVEGEHRLDPHFGCHTPPFRVCVACGYAEEGWGCGYHLLGKNDYGTKALCRNEALKHVVGRIRTQGELNAIRFCPKGAPQ
jgi:hypothetical protein